MYPAGVPLWAMFEGMLLFFLSATLSAVAAPRCLETVDPDQPVQRIPQEKIINLLAERNGCVVLVELYASWCGTCAVIDPAMAALVETYRPRGLQTLGLSVDNNEPAWLRWRKNHARMYAPHILEEWSSEQLKTIFSLYGASFDNAIPFVVLVDGQGHAVVSLNAPEDLTVLEAALEELLPAEEALR